MTEQAQMHPSQLPRPGQVVHLDFRRPDAVADKQQPPTTDPPQTTSISSRPLCLVQWNIERGYELPLVIQQLQQLDADIVALQEVDWACERSAGADTGAAIAKALGLNYLFVCEFEELHSPLRAAASQGGGVHGNAILSKFDFQSWDIIEHSHHPVDWNLLPEQQPHPLAAKEPRMGRRLSLAADVATPQGPVRVYCCHLEVFCGILSRVWQFSDILADARAKQQQQQQQQQGCRHQTQQQQQQQQQQNPQQQQLAADSLQQVELERQQQQQCHQVILGDLNTMGHSVARLSPNYCSDRMRWGSFGTYEAAWWQKHVLSVTDPSPLNKYLLKLGLPQAVAAAAVNPGFIDPFDVVHDVTLDNPKYRLGPLHLMAGKLDWVLLRGCQVVGKGMGNYDYAASDHKWLMVKVLLL